MGRAGAASGRRRRADGAPSPSSSWWPQARVGGSVQEGQVWPPRAGRWQCGGRATCGRRRASGWPKLEEIEVVVRSRRNGRWQMVLQSAAAIGDGGGGL
jgi:hypothetical protein